MTHILEIHAPYEERNDNRAFLFNPLESPHSGKSVPLMRGRSEKRRSSLVRSSRPGWSLAMRTCVPSCTIPGAFPRRTSSARRWIPPEVLEVLAHLPPEVGVLVNEDPPGHRRTRALVGNAFLPKQVARMEARIRAIAHELIDHMLEAGCADLVRQYTYPLPMRVLLEFLGLPVEDADFIKQWCNDHMLLSVPGIGAAQQLRSAQTEVAFSRYTEALIAARQRQPQADVLSALIHAQVEGERSLDVVELHALVQQLLFAGHETTTNLLSNTCCALLRDAHPVAARCTTT